MIVGQIRSEDVERVDAQPLVDHLLFHKALHGVGDDDGSRLAEYLDLARKLDSPQHVHTIEDPFIRTVGTLFSLVMERQVDPWDLDLNRMLQLWEKQMAKEEEIDFILAGNMVQWAYSVLKLRAEGVLEATQPTEEPWEEDWGEDWPEEWSDWAPPPGFVELVKEGTPAPLDEKVRHKGQRKVTLMELLGALEKARHDLKLRVNKALARKELRAEQEQRRQKAGLTIAGRLHDDDPYTDSLRLWEQLSLLEQDKLTFRELVAGQDKEGLVRTFLALLFLAKEGKVKLWQRGVNGGSKIYIRRLVREAGGGNFESQAQT